MILFYSLTGCGAVGSALDWGSRGREFKSRHSDQTQNIAFGYILCFFFYKARLELVVHLPSVRRRRRREGHIIGLFAQQICRAQPYKSRHSDQKSVCNSRWIFYPLRKQWHIIAVGVYHHALECISSAARLYFCFLNDDMQNCVLVICNSLRN